MCISRWISRKTNGENFHSFMFRIHFKQLVVLSCSKILFFFGKLCFCQFNISIDSQSCTFLLIQKSMWAIKKINCNVLLKSMAWELFEIHLFAYWHIIKVTNFSGIAYASTNLLGAGFGVLIRCDAGTELIYTGVCA